MNNSNNKTLNGNSKVNIPIHFAPRKMLMSVRGVTSKLADFIFLLRRQGVAITKRMLRELRSNQAPEVPMFAKTNLNAFNFSCRREDFPAFNRDILSSGPNTDVIIDSHHSQLSLQLTQKRKK